MRSVLALLATLVLLLTPAMAQPANPAEAFVARTVSEGLAILNDNSLAAEARGAQLEKLLLSATDLRRIALFTLGNAKAGEAEREAFVAAFRGFALSVYRTHFMSYAGRSVAVTGSRQNAPGDTVVHASLSAPGSAPTPVDVRVRTDGASPVIIDLGFSGVWLALTQRDDFAAYLSQNGGDVTKLTAYLESRAKAAR